MVDDVLKYKCKIHIPYKMMYNKQIVLSKIKSPIGAQGNFEIRKESIIE